MVAVIAFVGVTGHLPLVTARGLDALSSLLKMFRPE